jgi:hypothetical protein
VDGQRPRADVNGSGADVRLNDEIIQELAEVYLDLAGAELKKTGDVDCTALDRRFCGKLVAAGLIHPNSIEAEFKRVMAPWPSRSTLSPSAWP